MPRRRAKVRDASEIPRARQGKWRRNFLTGRILTLRFCAESRVETTARRATADGAKPTALAMRTATKIRARGMDNIHTAAIGEAIALNLALTLPFPKQEYLRLLLRL